MSWTDIVLSTGNTSINSQMCLGGFIRKKCSALSKKINQSRIDMPTAEAALLTFMTSSKAIASMPIMKITGIK